MFINFLKVTIRNLYREKMYAVINIFGLALAIACCIIIGLYLKSELTYDRHNTKYKQIFRIVNEYNVNSKTLAVATTSMSLGPMLAEDYPELNEFVRFKGMPQEQLIRYGDDAFYWNNICYADDNVFQIFTYNIIYGDPKTALVDPKSVAVSESFAKKYFGDANPIGEIISNEQGEGYKITLVFTDLPENTHLKHDVLLSYNNEEMAEPDNVTQRHQRLWTAQQNYTYFLMPEGYDIRDFKKISDSFFERHMKEMALLWNARWKCWLQPLADIHLQSDVRDYVPKGNRLYVLGFIAITVFILLVACINHMNLATALASRRAKVVGMQKILGAGKMRLMLQFLGESVFFSLIALLFGLAFVEIALQLTPINELLNKNLTLNLSHEPVLLAWMLILCFVIGLISGIYPALYLSSMMPLSALVKGNQAGKRGIRLREFLILIQFTISVVVIACTLLMALQMRYFSHKSLGFDKNNMVAITLRGSDIIDKIPTIKKELSKNSNILGITECSNIIGQSSLNLGMRIENNNGTMEPIVLRHLSVGDDFIKVMGVELLKGRDFSKKLLTDIESTFIVNETLVRKMGWEEPLGKHILMDVYNGIVIGVVKDFHFYSLHNQIESVALHGFVHTPDEYPLLERFLILKISREEMSRTLTFLENRFSEFDLKHPFQFEFLDDSLDKLYLSEQRLMKLIGIFAGICILISCMGLFGLSAFTTEQRTKEIGIRKVLGASTWQIISMLSNRILLLVLVGAVVASLVAYYVMDEWLSSFAYRTGINPLVFIVSAGIAAGVAFITVALQSYKTARANPIEALRYE